MAMGRQVALGLLVLAAGGVLAGCGNSSGTPDPGCPRISIVTDLSRATYFRPGAGRDLTDVVAEGELELRDMKCVYARNQVDLDFHVLVGVAPGPAQRERQIDVEYFVAVMDPNRAITAKETFRARVDFGNGRQRRVLDEQITPRIPLGDKAAGGGYDVLVGFQLTPDQLQWNQQQRRR